LFLGLDGGIDTESNVLPDPGDMKEDKIQGFHIHHEETFISKLHV